MSSISALLPELMSLIYFLIAKNKNFIKRYDGGKSGKVLTKSFPRVVPILTCCSVFTEFLTKNFQHFTTLNYFLSNCDVMVKNACAMKVVCRKTLKLLYRNEKRT